MKFDKEKMDELLKALESGDAGAVGKTLSDALGGGSLCGCGTVHQACEVALKSVRQALMHDCLIWSAQVHIAAAVMVSAVLHMMTGSMKYESHIRSKILDEIDKDADFQSQIANLIELALTPKAERESVLAEQQQ